MIDPKEQWLAIDRIRYRRAARKALFGQLPQKVRVPTNAQVTVDDYHNGAWVEVSGVVWISKEKMYELTEE